VYFDVNWETNAKETFKILQVVVMGRQSEYLLSFCIFAISKTVFPLLKVWTLQVFQQLETQMVIWRSERTSSEKPKDPSWVRALRKQ